MGSHPANISIDLYPVILFAILLLIISLSGNMGAIMKHSLPYPEGNQTKKKHPPSKVDIPWCLPRRIGCAFISIKFSGRPVDSPLDGIARRHAIWTCTCKCSTEGLYNEARKGKKEFQTTRPSINRSTR